MTLHCQSCVEATWLELSKMGDSLASMCGNRCLEPSILVSAPDTLVDLVTDLAPSFPAVFVRPPGQLLGDASPVPQDAVFYLLGV